MQIFYSFLVSSYSGHETPTHWTKEYTLHSHIWLSGLGPLLCLLLLSYYYLFTFVDNTKWQVGMGTVILHYFTGLVSSILEEIGISNEAYNPVSYKKPCLYSFEFQTYEVVNRPVHLYSHC